MNVSEIIDALIEQIVINLNGPTLKKMLLIWN